MRIALAGGGVGYGPSKVASFHDALASVGLEKFNLVRLSSVLPADWSVNRIDEYAVRTALQRGKHGDLLYSVYVKSYVRRGSNSTAGVAVCWSDEIGTGYFAEAESDSAADAKLEALTTLRHIAGKEPADLDPGNCVTSELSGSGEYEWGCALAVVALGLHPIDGTLAMAQQFDLP